VRRLKAEKKRESFALSSITSELIDPIVSGPNEASVRPYGTMLQEIVHAFEAKHACLYRIPEGVHQKNGFRPITLPIRRFCRHGTAARFGLPTRVQRPSLAAVLQADAARYAQQAAYSILQGARRVYDEERVYRPIRLLDV
jgi:hypothetical protein